ncbi:MAG: T9SS type A sorting domain-containing protein [Pricia sp.]
MSYSFRACRDDFSTGQVSYMRASLAQNIDLTDISDFEVDMTITNVLTGPTMHVSATATGGHPPYEWYINGTLQATTTAPDVLIRYRCTDVGLSDLEVRCPTTNCGPTSDLNFFYNDCSSSRQMAVYPNPSSSDLYIAKASLDEEGSPSDQSISGTSDMALDIEIFDFSGKTVRRQNFKKAGSIPRLNVSGLKKATYFLRITGKEVDEVHQIIVE